MYGPNINTINSIRYILNKSGALSQVPTGILDYNFGLSDRIDGYDKIRYSQRFINSENIFISEKTVFIFDRIENPPHPYDVADIRNNNQIVLVRSYHFKGYYIGRLKYVQGYNYPIFLPFDVDVPNFIVDSNMVILTSICRFIFTQT